MKPPKYTTREVVALLHQGQSGLDELLENKALLRDIHLTLILALAVESLEGGPSEIQSTACATSGQTDC
jgi:hypothetical protein